MTDKIGIIVPVYKTERYIAECIESILAQTYTNFRLILVDDGTPDNAGIICDEYALKDNRITVIHQENAGVTRARARGVEEASDCEWITFVDSDDTITVTGLEELAEVADERADIIIQKTERYNGIELEIEDYRSNLINGNGFNSPWGKLFRRSLFTENIFKISREIIVGEDMLMNIRLAFRTCKKVQYIKSRIYNYRQVADSTIHTFRSSHEYEYRFQAELIKSIPAEQIERYFTYTIENRLRCFKSLYGYRYRVKGMKAYPFYKQLCDDIKKCNYDIPFIDRIILKCTNPIIRFFAIQIKKIQKIYQAIKSNS